MQRRRWGKRNARTVLLEFGSSLAGGNQRRIEIRLKELLERIAWRKRVGKPPLVSFRFCSFSADKLSVFLVYLFQLAVEWSIRSDIWSRDERLSTGSKTSFLRVPSPISRLQRLFRCYPDILGGNAGQWPPMAVPRDFPLFAFPFLSESHFEDKGVLPSTTSSRSLLLSSSSPFDRILAQPHTKMNAFDFNFSPILRNFTNLPLPLSPPETFIPPPAFSLQPSSPATNSFRSRGIHVSSSNRKSRGGLNPSTRSLGMPETTPLTTCTYS